MSETKIRAEVCLIHWSSLWGPLYGEDADEHEYLCGLFLNSRESFHDAVAELNAWLMIQRYKEKVESSCKLNISQTRAEHFVKIDLTCSSKQYTLKELSKKFPEAFPVNVSEIQDVLRLFQEHSGERWKIFRGKYQVDFLRMFLIKLRSDCTSRQPSFSKKKRKVSLNVSRENILSELSQYADTPQCLVNFVMSFKPSVGIQ